MSSEWRFINPQVRQRCRDFADKIDAQKRGLSSSQYWNRDAHYAGLIGEWLVAHALGLEVNQNLLWAGDGKIDFPGIDVKTSTYWQHPHLRVYLHELDRGTDFVLVAWHEAEDRARICGWASSELIRTAGTLVDYGYGPRRSLYEEQLNPGLPLVAR